MISKRNGKKPTVEREASPRPVRVAVYTRKSVADRNAREFGSIDAQREAVEAYVRSQASNGWTALPRRYDDEGFSGGTTKRPAFERLLADVQAGGVDVVAVHRIDRLSRSLADFTQLIRLFEQHGVAFVSTSQQFDTSTSMGRFTLNILASFAEFEREIIRERTRDKMAASRKRGMWTGGRVPLGYDLGNKRLVVNETEAEVVREVFRLFREHGSILRVVEVLNDRGLLTKRGKPFDRGTVWRMLRNPLYVGRMRAGDEIVEGVHEAIISPEVWQQAQEILDRNKGRKGERRPSERLLAGLLRCGRCGAAMSPTHTRKGHRRHYYYYCGKADKQGAAACPGGRVPATDLERAVVERVRAIGTDPRLAQATAQAARREVASRNEALRRRLSSLEEDRDGLQRKRRTLLDRLGRNGDDRALHEGLGQATARLDAVDAETTRVAEELQALEAAEIDYAGIRAALTAFSPVWDELFPRERARVVRLLVEGVTYDPDTDEAAIRFRPEAVAMLGKETER